LGFGGCLEGLVGKRVEMGMGSFDGEDALGKEALLGWDWWICAAVGVGL